jgi:hypothetical protein
MQSQLRATRQVYQPVLASHIPTAFPIPVVPPPPLGPDVTQRLYELAEGRAPILLDPSFRPNDGCANFTPCAASSLPGHDLAIELLVAKDHHAGRSIILPRNTLLQHARAAGIPVHVSPAFIVRKKESDGGRLVQHYSATGPNHPDKRHVLDATWGRIQYPTIADFCATFLSVARRYPSEELVGYKLDFSDWFKRILLPIEQTGLFIFPIVHEEFGDCLVLPIVEQFGAQESNAHSNYGSACLHSLQTDRAIKLYGGPVSHLYSDDTFGVLPRRLVHAEVDANIADAEWLVGPGIINRAKLIIDTLFDVLAWQVNVPARALTMTRSLFLKLIALFCLELPAAITEHTRLPLRTLQRMSSYMILGADAAPPLLPFSRAATHNIAGHDHHHNHPVPLLPTTVHDIHYWRHILQSTLTPGGARFMIQSVLAPPLFHTMHGDDDQALVQRQVAAASYLGWGDAAKDPSRQGIGYVLTLANGDDIICWGADYVSDLCTYHINMEGDPAEISINILESAAAVATLAAVARHHLSLPVDQRPRHPDSTDTQHASVQPYTHVHIWSDSTSAISWLTKYRARHPLLALLLQVFSHLQHLSGLTASTAHLPGLLNIVADAASRNFATANGASVRALLAPHPRTQLSSAFRSAMARASALPLPTPSEIAALARTTAASMLL